MSNENCNVCGSPMYSQAYMGTDSAGDYCAKCYRNGQAYSRYFELNLFGQPAPWQTHYGSFGGRGY